MLQADTLYIYSLPGDILQSVTLQSASTSYASINSSWIYGMPFLDQVQSSTPSDDGGGVCGWPIGTILSLVAAIDVDQATAHGMHDVRSLQDFLGGRVLEVNERVVFYGQIRALLLIQHPALERWVDYGPLPSDMVAGWVAARAVEFGDFVELRVPPVELRSKIGFRRTD